MWKAQLVRTNQKNFVAEPTPESKPQQAERFNGLTV
jgi:hypothetical protein